MANPYNWNKLQDGDTNYPDSHSDLVDEIGAEIQRVEDDLGNHAGDETNPHSVMAAQANAIKDADGEVEQSHLAFDTADQGELDSHVSSFNSHTDAFDSHVADFGGHAAAASAHHGKTTTLADISDADPSAIRTGALADRPDAGTAGRWYLTTDENGIFHDDGTAWVLVAAHPSGIGADDLGFDPATQAALDSHAGATDNPHGVTASQAGALADDAGAVAESNLGFEVATQQELDTHAGATDAHHAKTEDTRTDVSDGSGVVVEDTGDVAFVAEDAASVGVAEDTDADGGPDGTATVTIGATDTTTEDTRTDIEGDAGVVVADAEGVAFAADGAASVAVAEDTDGTATVTVSATDTDTTARWTTTTQTTAYQASDLEVVLADASGGAFDVTLPPAAADVRVAVKKTDGSANAVTIATADAETIDGAATRDLAEQWEPIEVISDGTDWFVI